MSGNIVPSVGTVPSGVGAPSAVVFVSSLVLASVSGDGPLKPVPPFAEHAEIVRAKHIHRRVRMEKWSILSAQTLAPTRGDGSSGALTIAPTEIVKGTAVRECHERGTPSPC